MDVKHTRLLQDDYRAVVVLDKPDVPNGAARAEQAPLVGQQRLRLLACATCLLLIGWQAPGSNVDSGQPGGRVLMHAPLEGSSMGSSGQMGRTLKHELLDDSLGSAALGKESLTSQGGIYSAEDASQHMRRQILVVDARLVGHHWMPKWVRCACSTL